MESVFPDDGGWKYSRSGLTGGVTVQHFFLRRRLVVLLWVVFLGAADSTLARLTSSPWGMPYTWPESRRLIRPNSKHTVYAVGLFSFSTGMEINVDPQHSS